MPHENDHVHKFMPAGTPWCGVCPKEPCGAVATTREVLSCDFHGRTTKGRIDPNGAHKPYYFSGLTHWASACPGAPR